MNILKESNSYLEFKEQNPISDLYIWHLYWEILETKPDLVNVLEVCQTDTIKTTLSQGL